MKLSAYFVIMSAVIDTFFKEEKGTIISSIEMGERMEEYCHLSSVQLVMQVLRKHGILKGVKGAGYQCVKDKVSLWDIKQAADTLASKKSEDYSFISKHYKDVYNVYQMLFRHIEGSFRKIYIKRKDANAKLDNIDISTVYNGILEEIGGVIK